MVAYVILMVHFTPRNNNRQGEIRELTSRGIIPNEHELEQHPEKSLQSRTFRIGRVAAVINEILPAKVIVTNMVEEAAEVLKLNASRLGGKAKL